MVKKSNTNDFIEKSIIVHGNKYNYSSTEYIDCKTKLCIICKMHGKFYQTPNCHLRGNGCPKCCKTLKKTTVSFIERANEVHKNMYDYSDVNYINNRTKINIICRLHGSFYQMPTSHLMGRGCPECAKITIGNSLKLKPLDFVNRSNSIHNYKYDYSEVYYINDATKVKIICPQHDGFYQSPNNHLQGKGCDKCVREGNRLGIELFIERSNVKHDNKYDYSKVIYTNIKTKVIIVCPKHGDFEQTPHIHLSGHGCPKCVGKVSKMETDWLNSLNILPENRNIKLPGLGLKEVDGYDPITKTVYEFNGDFWHGNPDVYSPNDINCIVGVTFGFLYNKFIEREAYVKGAGYNLVTMWENDWMKISDGRQRKR